MQGEPRLYKQVSGHRCQCKFLVMIVVHYSVRHAIYSNLQKILSTINNEQSKWRFDKEINHRLKSVVFWETSSRADLSCWSSKTNVLFLNSRSDRWSQQILVKKSLNASAYPVYLQWRMNSIAEKVSLPAWLEWELNSNLTSGLKLSSIF